MDYAPGANQYQPPDSFFAKIKRFLADRGPAMTKFLFGILYWVVKLIRDFLRDAFNSVLGRG